GLAACTLAPRLGQSPMALSDRGLESGSNSNIVVERTTNDMPFFLLCVVSLLLGCAALILQVVWTRQLALILGGSTYAFTAMLFVVLVGIGLGSIVFHLFFTHSRNPVPAAATILFLLTGTAVAGTWLLPHLAALV